MEFCNSQYRGRIGATACQGACAGGDGLRLVVFVFVCAGLSGCTSDLADLDHSIEGAVSLAAPVCVSPLLYPRSRKWHNPTVSA